MACTTISHASPHAQGTVRDLEVIYENVGAPGHEGLAANQLRLDEWSVLKQREVAKRVRDSGRPVDSDVCSMCGEYCVFRLADEVD